MDEGVQVQVKSRRIHDARKARAYLLSESSNLALEFFSALPLRFSRLLERRTLGALRLVELEER